MLNESKKVEQLLNEILDSESHEIVYILYRLRSKHILGIRTIEVEPLNKTIVSETQTYLSKRTSKYRNREARRILRRMISFINRYPTITPYTQLTKIEYLACLI